MKVYQLKFRISCHDLGQVLESLGDVGPVVVELVDEPVTNVTRAIFTQRSVIASEAVQTEGWIPTAKKYGTGKQTVLDKLAGGPAPFTAIADVYVAAGMKKTGLGALLSKMLIAGLIQRGKQGWWELTEKKETE